MRGYWGKGIFLAFLFTVNMIKLCAAGEYLPLQDDFIQYWGYGERSMAYLFREVGFFDTRPFAGLLDIFLWGKFWGRLGAAAVVITLLHFISAVFFIKAFENIGISCGGIFAVVYLLFPAGFEAVYWVSASSRIAVGLFFASLSAYIAGKENISAAAVFWADLLAFGFYEQTAAVGFALCIWTAAEKKRTDLVICAVMAAAVMCVYYKVMSGVGALGGRAAVRISPAVTAVAFAESFAAAAELFFVKNVFGLFGIMICTIAGAGMFLLYNNYPDGTVCKNKKLYMGAVLSAAAVSVHFAAGSGYIPLRCLYPAAAGLALMTEYIIEKISIGRIFIGIFTAYALSANMYQARIFTAVGEFNMQVCENTAAADGRVYRLDNRELDLSGFEPPERYRKYIIEDITKSGWAFTGAVRAYYGDIRPDGVGYEQNGL